jgi:hypothetical protein
MARAPGPPCFRQSGINVVAYGQGMSNTTKMTASPGLRAMFVIGAATMLALRGWSLVPPIKNWGKPSGDGFSYVAVFYTTLICLPVGLGLLIGAIAGQGRSVGRARIAVLSLPE